MECIRDGVLVVRAKYVETQEHQCPEPSIRIAVSAGHAKRDVERAGMIIRDSMKKVLKRYAI